METEMKAIERYRKIQELEGKADKAPYSVHCMFEGYGLQRYGIEVVGNQISFGEDYVTVERAKEGLDWLVEQLGGVVLWDVE